MRSGVPILDALEIVSETAGNAIVADAVADTQAAVKSGESLAKPLEAHPVFPPMVTQMIAVGEETGALDELLEKIADFYDAEVEATVDALTSLIEPLLIVVMGVTVGGMVVALYMPMFSHHRQDSAAPRTALPCHDARRTSFRPTSRARSTSAAPAPATRLPGGSSGERGCGCVGAVFLASAIASPRSVEAAPGRTPCSPAGRAPSPLR